MNLNSLYQTILLFHVEARSTVRRPCGNLFSVHIIALFC